MDGNGGDGIGWLVEGDKPKGKREKKKKCAHARLPSTGRQMQEPLLALSVRVGKALNTQTTFKKKKKKHGTMVKREREGLDYFLH